ncbi:MAG: RimK family alpha-L-glutamate ligase [Isosphaeraceae bacterium]|nr:RimK family alpha-L-glutamate ligase [Isosphaeraceae bacterium]
MKRLVALVSGLGWHVEDLTRAADRLGIDFAAVPFPSVSAFVGHEGTRVHASGIDLGQVEGVLVRMMPPGTLEQVVFRMDALHRLSARGVAVMNPPRAVEAAVDKYLALALLDAAGIAVPPTWAGESADDALGAFDALGGDVVVKPLFGSEGRGLMRVSDRELARRAFSTLERLGAVLYLQRVVRHAGHDVRVFVLGGRVLGSFRRHAASGDWRTNIALGGRPEVCTIDNKTEQLALRAARAVGAEMAGVDVIDDLDRGAPVVLEVNAVPGWRALAQVTGIDVAAEILAHLRELAS